MSTKRRDPDIMAMDHAVRSLMKSTPRMLRVNLEFITYLIEKRIEAYRQKGIHIQ